MLQINAIQCRSPHGFTGKPDGGAPEKNQEMRVVLDMMQGLNGYNITCDNFFTLHKLGQELLERKLIMIQKKPELPSQLLTTTDSPVNSSRFVFTAYRSLGVLRA